MSEEHDHDQGGSVKERLVRIETKLTALIETREDTEDRVRSLERHRWTIYGALAVVTFFKEKLGRMIFGP